MSGGSFRQRTKDLDCAVLPLKGHKIGDQNKGERSGMAMLKQD